MTDLKQKGSVASESTGGTVREQWLWVWSGGLRLGSLQLLVLDLPRIQYLEGEKG